MSIAKIGVIFQVTQFYLKCGPLCANFRQGSRNRQNTVTLTSLCSATVCHNHTKRITVNVRVQCKPSCLLATTRMYSKPFNTLLPSCVYCKLCGYLIQMTPVLKSSVSNVLLAANVTESSGSETQQLLTCLSGQQVVKILLGDKCWSC